MTNHPLVKDTDESSRLVHVLVTENGKARFACHGSFEDFVVLEDAVEVTCRGCEDYLKIEDARERQKELRSERITEKLDDTRDESGIPYDQLQIGDPVFYWPEGVDAVVEGYEWGMPLMRIEDGVRVPEQPPRITGYRLSCGITAMRAHLMRRLLI